MKRQSHSSGARALALPSLLLTLSTCAAPPGDGGSVETRSSAVRATTNYTSSGGSQITMFPLTDGYCFVGNTTAGLNPGDGPAATYMTLDAHNNWVLTGVGRPTKVNWLQMGGDSTHAGNNTGEKLITKQTVGFLSPLDGYAGPNSNLPPVVVTSIAPQINNPTNVVTDLAFTTQGGTTTAFDAYTGKTYWTNPGSGTAIGRVGQGSPAIDASLIYVYGIGKDGGVHKYRISDGAEVCASGCTITDSHWPQKASAKPSLEPIRTSLTVGISGSTPYLYAGTAGNDSGDYQGNVTAINLSTGTQKTFNAMCASQTGHLGVGACTANGGTSSVTGGGVWALGGVPFDPATNKVYFASGNGTLTTPGLPATGTYHDPAHGQYSDSLLKLNADGSGTGSGPVDSYTPAVAVNWDDNDLGSTNTLILTNSSKYPHLAFQSGKDGMLRLINLDNMSGQGGPGHVTPEGAVFSMALPIAATQQAAGQCNEGTCAVVGPLTTWVDPADGTKWIYVSAGNQGLNAIQFVVTNGVPSLVGKWQKTDGGGSTGGAFVANGILYWGDKTKLWALDAKTGAALWSTASTGGASHATPVVINGVLYFNGGAWGVGGRTFGTGGLSASLASRIGATCVAWDNLNAPGQVGAGNVYVSGTLPDYPNANLPAPAPSPASGQAMTKMVSAPGLHQHFFHDATTHMPASGTLGANDVISVSYYLDPSDAPTEVAVQLEAANGNFWYRMYVGNEVGKLGTVHSGGTLAAPGKWAVMSATAGTLHLTGSYVKGISFVVDKGQAYFDKVSVTQSGTTQIWIDDGPPEGAQFGPPPGYDANKMVSGDNEGLDGEGWVWVTGWTNSNTTRVLGPNQWTMCQISGVSGPWPVTGGRSIVLDWPGKSVTYSGDQANATNTWKVHQSGASGPARVSTACADFGLEAYISPGGFTSYTQSLAETQALSGFANPMQSLLGGFSASTSAACALSGMVGGTFTPTANNLRATILPDGAAQDLSNWGNMKGTLGICYEPGAFGPFGY
ncbi:MAG TPA: PQQ-binding-like beta-propeller repeat protein [Polyangia bacterium]|nr:PQQ-binding-like beta-propeller repeat protein [Polyangia bacterium]